MDYSLFLAIMIAFIVISFVLGLILGKMFTEIRMSLKGAGMTKTIVDNMKVEELNEKVKKSILDDRERVVERVTAAAKKKKPTRSAVMKNPSPADIRKKKEKEALALQMESIAVDKRESGSGEVPPTIEL